jgi:glutaredoxin
LYRRSGCHLCEEMAQQLRALGLAFEEIDVDSDPALRLKYGRDVPVLVFEDLVYKHRLTPEAIAKLR